MVKGLAQRRVKLRFLAAIEIVVIGDAPARACGSGLHAIVLADGR